MTALLARFIGLPKWAHFILAALAIFAGFALWLWQHDKGVVSADRAKAVAEIAPRQIRAEAAAQATTAAIQTKAENENADARAAAAGSGDPLKSGFDSLRTRQAGSHPATR